MKKIIKEGNVKIEKFKCDKCGCEFESDEYSFEESSSICNALPVKDECPTCRSVIYKY